MQVDDAARLTFTLAVFSGDAETVQHATLQVLHFTAAVGGRGAVARVAAPTHSRHRVAVRPCGCVPGYPGRVGHAVQVACDSLRLAWG